MRVFATGGVLFTFLLTAACATAPLESQTQAQDKRQARIYVLRESSLLYSAGAPNVKINGQNVGTVASGSSFFVDRPPGSYVITLETPLVPGRYAANVTVRAGAVHYLKVAPRTEYFALGLATGGLGQLVEPAVSENSGSYSLTPLDEKAGAAMLAQLKG